MSRASRSKTKVAKKRAATGLYHRVGELLNQKPKPTPNNQGEPRE
jgi:hypothetical protein